LGVVGLTIMLSLISLSAPAYGTSGTLTINANTTLTEDHSGNIVIGTNGVTLDCAGHSVIGPGVGTGISATGRTGVTVQNCVVTGFWFGIVFSGGSSNTLTGNTATGNSLQGIMLTSNSLNVLTGNNASGNGVGNGIRLVSSSSNSITTNVANGNGVGIFLSGGSSSNTITGNSATGNVAHGILLLTSNSLNTLTGNNASGNGVGNGIRLVSSSSNTVTGNTANGNGVGIFLSDGSSSNTVTGNSATGNIAHGILLLTSNSLNVLSGNDASGNGAGNGIRLLASSSNTITTNTANGNGVGIFLSNGSASNIITGNTANGNLNGIRLDASPSNTVTANSAGGSTFNGIHLLSALSNSLTGNTASGNGWNGIFLDCGSSLNTVTGNTANGNVLHGISSSPSNTVTGNTVSGNSLSGLFVDCVPHFPPVAAITGPLAGTVLAVGVPALFTATVDDPDAGDSHTATWTLTSPGATLVVAGTVTQTLGGATVTASVIFTIAGIYAVSLSVSDSYGDTDTASTIGGLPAFVVVYDPEGGFVTGGGWINSPEGAYVANLGLTGKATFGFVAKYQKGATTPTGQTEFHFKAGYLNFHSATYDWLVVGGARAQFKGTGTINGAGDYGFLLTAVDGQLPGGGGSDLFRMKIWDRATGLVVYDNLMDAADDAAPTTTLGGGSIQIKK